MAKDNPPAIDYGVLVRIQDILIKDRDPVSSDQKVRQLVDLWAAENKRLVEERRMKNAAKA